MCEHEIERGVALITGGNSDTEESFVHTDHLDRDLETSYQTRERALNAAIVQANISESFEEHLGIFDAFYADDIEVSSETHEEKIRGKARVRALLGDFLIPLHIMAEIGGLQANESELSLSYESEESAHLTEFGRHQSQQSHSDGRDDGRRDHFFRGLCQTPEHLAARLGAHRRRLSDRRRRARIAHPQHARRTRIFFLRRTVIGDE